MAIDIAKMIEETEAKNKEVDVKRKSEEAAEADARRRLPDRWKAAAGAMTHAICEFNEELKRQNVHSRFRWSPGQYANTSYVSGSIVYDSQWAAGQSRYVSVSVDDAGLVTIVAAGGPTGKWHQSVDTMTKERWLEMLAILYKH